MEIYRTIEVRTIAHKTELFLPPTREDLSRPFKEWILERLRSQTAAVAGKSPRVLSAIRFGEIALKAKQMDVIEPQPQILKFEVLSSADQAAWSDSVSVIDGLPIRPSGGWIHKKHRLLTCYATLFATGMKNRWKERIYLELFSGPGRCFVRDTAGEEPGSPLKVIDHEFTRFIFVERNRAAADALHTRLEKYPNADRVEILCGDCAEAIKEIKIPKLDALTFAFIDPTGIAHAPFSLVKELHQAARCDLLINIQHGMGIKMNLHQYTPDSDEESALTKFLGHDKWKTLLPATNAGDFFRSVLDLYKQNLRTLGFRFIGREVLISTTMNTPLYLLLYASKHPKGAEFWQKALKSVQDPEFAF